MKTDFSSLLAVLPGKKLGAAEQKPMEINKTAEAAKGLGHRGPLSPVVEIGLIFLAITLVLLVVLVK